MSNQQAKFLAQKRQDLRILLAQQEALRQEYKYWRDIGKMNDDSVALDLLPIIHWEADQLADRIAATSRSILLMFGGSTEG